ncbi:YgjV family protein [Shewanella surugensis]|uniref:YgjV family protein n=1 Tax=Shewanella surugensis TaxID=212020 RepID=A0ABT0LEZ5_9GAMM|nr:YgjV family protein [Shewanella surugensis]MCL1126129.1 YgjV family protein [Shewanella surugensis]
MQLISMVELLGYFASIVVAVSFMMKDIIKLRCLNCTGCLLFALYGVLIDAWPVAGMNAFIAGVNFYHLFKIYLKNKYVLK